MKKHFIWLIVIFAQITQLQAQTINKNKLDSLLTLLEESENAMGTVSVWQQGKPVYNRSIGYANMVAQQKATPTTRYGIGSISKVFTAVVVLKLAEAEKLKLTDRLSQYYPTIPNANKINIEHLLRHRSGLPNFTAQKDFYDWNTQPQTNRQLLSKFENGDTNFEPDTKFEYSNTNYVLLTLIAEKVAEQPFAKLLSKYITQPLQLNHTTYGPPQKVADPVAEPYLSPASQQPQPKTHHSIPKGAGALYSTATDLAVFANSLFTGKLISERHLAKMKELKDGYGLGLLQFPFFEHRALGHNGGIDGFVANMAYFEKEKITVAYTSNAVVYPFNDVLIGILSCVFDRPYTLPTLSKPLQLSASAYAQYQGLYKTPQLPIDINIFVKHNNLYAQATGQPAFMLTPLGNHTFEFKQALVKMVFAPEDDKLTFSQAGASFVLKR